MSFENWEKLRTSFYNGTIKNIDFAISQGFISVITGDKSIITKNRDRSLYEVIVGDRVYVLKAVHSCSIKGPNVHRVNQRECNLAIDGNNIKKIVSSDKVKYIFPNVLLEPMIGIILSDLTYNLESISFPKILGAYYDFSDHTTYTLSEKYYNMSQIEKLRRYNFTFNEGIHILFQLSHALSVAQKKYLFTHYDFHGGNILFNQLDQSYESISYTLYDRMGNKKYIYVKNIGCYPVIIDFEYARLEDKNKTIEPAIADFPSRSFGGFDNHVDFLSLLGSLYEKNHNFDMNKIMRRIGFDNNVIMDLLSKIFKTNNVDLIKSYYDKPRAKWRMGDFLLDQGSILDTDEITNLLADKLVDIGLASYDYPMTSSVAMLNDINYNNTNNFGVMKANIPLDSEVNFGNGFIYGRYSFKNAVNKFFKKGIPKYIHTPTNELYNSCYNSDQIFHIMYVDQEKITKYGYKIVNDCCKIDPIEYVKQNEGFVINGGFFDISETYNPIGPYRNSINRGHDYEHIKIPELYKDVYGFIYFDKVFNIISLTPYKNFDWSNETPDAFFAAGPMLVENGVPVFTENTINQKRFVNSKDTYIYHCRNSSNDEIRNKINPIIFESSDLIRKNSQCQEETIHVNDAMPNCSQIKPGQLSHASNPNPRSAFVIRNNIDGKGDYAFVVLEGRRNHGDGLDLHILSEILVLNPINAINAINLDGGISSNFAWRFGNSISDDLVFTPNRYRPNYYPVGNVFGFIKNT